jgi:3-hydroxyisobutyrate dehydrogenase
MASRIAFIGTGLLGSGMIRRFLKAGTPVRVWNRTEAKAEALMSVGPIVICTGPADVAVEADHIHLVLSDDAVVDAVIDEMASALQRGAMVIDHSTTLPEKTKQRFERLRDRGIRFLHAPVFMSPQMAEDGVGLMLVSGPKKEFDEARGELEGMTGEVWNLGERTDLAAAYKLFGNCMLFAISAGLSDVIAMARANDIDPVDAMSVFTKFQAGNVIAGRGPRMARGEVTPASFEVSMARKDVRLMIEAAKTQPLLALPAVARRMDEVIASGGGDHDLAALANTARR